MISQRASSRAVLIKREKDSVKEVKSGYECGITIENFNDLKEGDCFETYEMIEVKRK